MTIIGMDVSSATEKRYIHNKKWISYVIIMNSLVHQYCPKCSYVLSESNTNYSDLSCFSCNNQYIITGENQLERTTKWQHTGKTE